MINSFQSILVRVFFISVKKTQKPTLLFPLQANSFLLFSIFYICAHTCEISNLTVSLFPFCLQLLFLLYLLEIKMVKSSSCCEEQVGLKRGPWTQEEDQKLMSYIQLHGAHGIWSSLPSKAGTHIFFY